MKFIYAIGVFFCLFAWESSVSATTLKWRYRLPDNVSVTQIFADTGGGVAVVDSGVKILWLDNQGKEILTRSFYPAPSELVIVGATRQAITYTFGGELNVIDRHGREFALPRTSVLQYSAPLSTYTNEFGVYALEGGTSADPTPSIVFYAYNP